MIIDIINNSERYSSLSSRFSEAFEFLSTHDLLDLPTGRVNISGNDIYALVSDYETKPVDECVFEAHQKYIDIQYVVSGAEMIGFAPLQEQSIIKPYDKEHDYALYSGVASLIKVEVGMFAIFFPGDLHMPGIGDDLQKVRKIVLKVRIHD